MLVMQWDLFCKVIDNHGDVGVCWRLAADLAERGEQVQLWIDDALALAWMAPHGAPGVTVLAWPTPDAEFGLGDVVVEAFGCDLPDFVVRRMSMTNPRPVWINLEYLSAQSFVERAHRLSSPQVGPGGVQLQKWFFYPGFTDRTGGLLRERDLLRRQREFDARAWLAANNVPISSNQTVVSLFCYAQAALPDLLDQWAGKPTVVLATAGQAAQQVSSLLGASLRRDSLQALLLPPLAQREYDHLLWASDINFVRGEDSFVRAQWAAKPFIWQIYPQADGVHLQKMEAFLSRFLQGTSPELGEEVRSFWRAWNVPGQAIPNLAATPDWTRLSLRWRGQLLGQADLATHLVGFARETR
jgi:uncharacterized repeat protein (TIGR03837 family)